MPRAHWDVHDCPAVTRPIKGEASASFLTRSGAHGQRWRDARAAGLDVTRLEPGQRVFACEDEQTECLAKEATAALAALVGARRTPGAFGLDLDVLACDLGRRVERWASAMFARSPT